MFLIEHLAISSYCGRNWESWNKILDRFENTIIGHFAGHTHDDTFTVTLDRSSRPIGSIFYPGSITTQGRNPGFRVYKVHRRTKAVLDYTQYWANLSEANANPSVGPDWKIEYAASEAYDVKSLSPIEWYKLTQRMFKNSTLAESFVERKTKLYSSSCKSSNCLHNTVCSVFSVPPGMNVSELC